MRISMTLKKIIFRVIFIIIGLPIASLLMCVSSGQSIVSDKIDTVEEGTEGKSISAVEYIKPEGYNFRIKCMNTSLENTKKSFIKIYINDEEVGRTETGYDNDAVSYQTLLEMNKTLELRVEKYILDDQKGRYVKMRNIDQPKPDRYRFLIPEGRILIVNFYLNSETRESSFSENFAVKP